MSDLNLHRLPTSLKKGSRLILVKFVYMLFSFLDVLFCSVSGHMVHHVKMGSTIKKCVHQIPNLDLEATIQPITRTVLRVRLVITPQFKWDDKVNFSFFIKELFL